MPSMLLVVDELGDLLEQHFLVDLVGQLVDDDRLPRALVDVLEVRSRPDHDAAAAGAVALVDARGAVDHPGGREIGRRHELDQLLDRDIGIREQREARVECLGEIMRRDVRRHPDRDARRAVDEEIRQARREHRGLLLLAIVVRDEIDRLAVDIRDELGGDPREPALGVAHGRRVVAVDRAEVALAVDQRVAHREILRHSHQRVVDRRVAVRVVFAHHVADHARAFHVWPVPDDVRFLHRVEHPAVHRLQPVADIGQRAAHDNAHRVVEIRAPHLLFEAYREGFFRELIHQDGGVRRYGAGSATPESRRPGPR